MLREGQAGVYFWEKVVAEMLLWRVNVEVGVVAIGMSYEA